MTTDVIALQRQRVADVLESTRNGGYHDTGLTEYWEGVVLREWEALDDLVAARVTKGLGDNAARERSAEYRQRQDCEHDEQAGPYMQCQHCEALIEYINVGENSK